jgi:hypothetical protein
MLLTAMFMASCYWPPVPLDTPLSKPWSDNITTFGEALLSRIPEIPTDLMPATIPIVDRCWCEFSMGLFEPFNTTRWEVRSVEKLRADLKQQMLAKNISAQPIDVGTSVEYGEAGESTSEKLNSTAGFSMLSNAVDTLAAVQRRLGFSRGSEPDFNVSTLASNVPPITDIFPSDELKKETTIFREYDLRPYGFDMVIDLGWPLSP